MTMTASASTTTPATAAEFELANKNYERGVRFERERMKHWSNFYGHEVFRTAGSHGKFDLITVSPDGVIQLIQCKVTADPAVARRLLKKFREAPPLGYRPLARYQQTLEVKVLNQGVESTTI